MHNVRIVDLFDCQCHIVYSLVHFSLRKRNRSRFEPLREIAVFAVLAAAKNVAAFLPRFVKLETVRVASLLRVFCDDPPLSNFLFFNPAVFVGDKLMLGLFDSADATISAVTLL